MISRWAIAAVTGLCLAIMLPAAAARADSDLVRVMRVSEAVDVLRDEGLMLGAEMDRDMLGGSGGAHWRARISALYDTEAMTGILSRALDDGLDDAETAAVIDWFDTPLGQRILKLENGARRAIAEPDIEEIARQTYRDIKGSGDAKLALVAEFIAVNDLVERNVAGSLSYDLAFTRGMIEGGAFKMGEQEMLAEIWSREPTVREDTESWLYGFLLMAYRPLSDADLKDYIAFSRGPVGQALNAALFDGFERVYGAIAVGLGVEVARAMASSEL